MNIKNHYPLVQSGAATVAALAVGFVFGVQFTGRLATANRLAVPEWVSTAQTAQVVALAVFAVCVLGAAAIEVSETNE